MISVRKLAAAAVGLSMLAGAASATTIITTYTGTVSGNDTDGLFGAKGASLAGDTFTSVYTTTTGGTEYHTTTPTFEEVVGGAGYGAGHSSPVSAVFTLSQGSVVLGTYSIDGSDDGDMFVSTGSSSGTIFDFAESPSDYVINTVGSGVSAFVPSASVAATVSYTLTGDDHTSGTFGYGSTTLTLATQKVTSGVQTGVPEPATWALLIAGFGGVGVMLRRRRVATA
ncbi:MAG TPA: PEPxxWA-CTERM sorting domain-containing protein [Caulobacteraceae bacterium]|jgi:hypothetical protein